MGSEGKQYDYWAASAELAEGRQKKTSELNPLTKRNQRGEPLPELLSNLSTEESIVSVLELSNWEESVSHFFSEPEKRRQKRRIRNPRRLRGARTATYSREVVRLSSDHRAKWLPRVVKGGPKKQRPEEGEGSRPSWGTGRGADTANRIMNPERWG